MRKISLSQHNRNIIYYFVACILACFGFGQIIDTYLTYTFVIMGYGISAAVFYFFYERYMKKKQQKPSVMIPIILIGIFVMQCLYVVMGEMIYCNYTGDNIQWIFSGILFVGLFIIGGGLIFQYKNGKISAEQMITIIIFMTFLFRLIYAQFTSGTNLSRQNDTIVFTNGGGHLGYIWHIWANGKLPQVDPRTMWEFSQPPLYYILCGLWVKFNTILGIAIPKAAENIQLFSLFCVTATTIFLDKIMITMKLEAKKRLWAIVLFSVIPYFTYLSGAVNNDVLMVLLTVMSLYYVLKWYKEPKVSLLLINAVLTGLLVMTKSSGALVAPAIVVIFVIRLVKDRECRGKRILQYLLYGIVSIPIGLWWNIRNMIRFDMPFLYVNEPNQASIQYIPNYSIWERLFDMDNQWNHLYTELSNTSPNVDHNIWISTIKTLVFSHSYEMMKTDVTHFWGLLLFIFTILLVIIMIVFGVLGILKSKVETYHKYAWVCLFLCYIVFYLQFNISYPFVHTMHARYLLPVFALGIIWMIAGLEWYWEKYLNDKFIFKRIIKLLSVIYILLYNIILQNYIIQILIQAGERI